jgi:hypothetical protein
VTAARRRLEDVVLPHQISRQWHPHTAGAHQRDDVIEIVRERLDVAVVAPRSPTQRQRGHRVGARRAADAEVDATGMRGLQERELLGDGQRRVVGQHHAAGPQPQLRRVCAKERDQHRRAGGRDGGHVVVLGHPVAGVAEVVGRLCEVSRRRKRIGRCLVGAHRHQVENGKTHASVNAALSMRVP